MYRDPGTPVIEVELKAGPLDPSCRPLAGKPTGSGVAVRVGAGSGLGGSTASAARGVVVEVWLARHPRFGLDGLKVRYDPADFEHVADFLLETAGSPSEEWVVAMLECVYRASQNLDDAWRPEEPCRSSSVGDVLVLRLPEQSHAYVVANLGFEKTKLG